MIEDLKVYNNFIIYNNSKENEELSKYNKKIVTSTLQYINSEENEKEFSKYEKRVKRAREILQFKKSYIFLSIFNDIKNKIEGQKAVDIAIEKMKNLKKIFVNDEKKIEEELKNNPEVNYLINLGYQNQENLIKELDWLLNYFNIKNYNKEVLIQKINIYGKNKSLFSVISGILNLSETYKNIFKYNRDNNEETNFYNKLNEYKILLGNQKNISIEIIENINEYIGKNFTIINSNNKEKIFEIFILLNQYPDCLNFIIDKKTDEISNLFDFLLEKKNKDICDFINTISFFQEINDKENNSFFDFANEIINGSLDDSLCGKSLINYIKKYNYIKTLFDKYLKHSEGIFNLIINIMNKSEFTITKHKKKPFYEIKGFYYQNNDNNVEKILLIYKSLEYIYQRVIIEKTPEKSKKSVELFNKFFKNINQFIDIFNELYAKGYQEIFKVEITINECAIDCNYNMNLYNIKELNEKFLNLKIEIFKKLNEFYYKNGIIRLFYGRQLFLIYQNINYYIHKKENKNIDFLKSISNNIIQGNIPNNLEFSFGNFYECNEYTQILESIIKYIETDLQLNNKTLKDIYDFNIIKEDKKWRENKEFKGFFFHISANQEIDSLNI